MGEAYDRTGAFLGAVEAESKREVFEKLQKHYADVAEMPRYRCHKEVYALKIGSFEFDCDLARIQDRETDGSVKFTPTDSRYAPIRLDADFMRKHNPKPGGYYVVYKDGYRSYSPPQAFEEGYTLL